MIDTLYIESAIAEHARAQKIKQRFPQARHIECEHYGEVFNRSAQHFRLQKTNPALILAEKHGNTVLPTPPGYGIGGDNNYYFSHMLNCVYDCRYCFLQGMYRSAHYVVFINYEDFFSGIEQTLNQHPGEDVWFFSGYDCDSLALEPITGFVDETLDFFAQHSQAKLELRTKSTQIRSLLKRDPLPNCVVAYSLNPHEIAQSLEHKTPALKKRIEAMKSLQASGWPVGLRFDPVIYADDYRDIYAQLFEQVFSALDIASIHSTTLGTFRLPQHFFRKVLSLYPEEKLFAAKMSIENKQAGYPAELENDMLDFCRKQLLQAIPADRLFINSDEAA